MQHPPKKQKKTRPAVRRTVVVMLLAVVLAAAFVIGIPHFKARHPGKSAPIEVIPPDFRTLEIREGKELDTIVMHPASGESYTLKMQDGALHLLDGGELLPVSDLYADELLEVLTHIVAQETVTTDAAEVADHLADMGLEPPKAKAVIRYQDGSEAVLEVGASVPNTTYAYYRWSGDPGIYMCDVGIAEAFALTRSHLLPIVQPTVHPSLVTELRLTNAKGESRFLFENGGAGWLAEPYTYPLSDTAVDTLLSAVQNLRLGTRQSAVTDENRSAYGFDDPVCTISILQKEGVINQIGPDGALVSASVPVQELQFVIGRAEGDFFYTCEYQGDCYFISRFLAEVLVGADRDAFITQTPAVLSDALAGLLIQAPQGSVKADILRSERVLPNNELEVSETGEPVYDVRIAINGVEAAPEMADELSDRLLSLAAAGTVPDSFVLPGDALPRWSLMVESTSGEVRSIAAYRMDAFSDALMVDGVMRHYVHSDALDVLMAGLL